MAKCDNKYNVCQILVLYLHGTEALRGIMVHHTHTTIGQHSDYLESLAVKFHAHQSSAVYNMSTLNKMLCKGAGESSTPS